MPPFLVLSKSCLFLKQPVLFEMAAICNGHLLCCVNIPTVLLMFLLNFLVVISLGVVGKTKKQKVVYNHLNGIQTQPNIDEQGLVSHSFKESQWLRGQTITATTTTKNIIEKTSRQTDGATRIALKASMKILVLKLCVVAVLFSF